MLGKLRNKKKSTADLLFNDYEEDYDCFKLKNDTYMDILQIRCKDLKNLSQNLIDLDNLTFVKLYRTYSDDIKFVGMNFPTDTSKQREYFKHKIQTTENEIYKNMLISKLEELDKVHRLITEREFYVFIYGENTNELLDNRSNIISKLRAQGLIDTISKEKKEKILYKLNNKNSSIYG